MKDENGETRVERNARFGQEDKTPEEPELPSYMDHLIGFFWGIGGQRLNGMNGSEPLQWSDIEAWSRLTRTPLLPEEVDILIAMDRAYRQAVAAEQKDAAEQKKDKPPAKQRLWK